jgi:glycerophosphoryl diester phosphodiesterase
LAFSHRGGASGDRPENTLAAFRGAVEVGYRYLETDAHCTADGRLIAFHDAELDRVTDHRGRVAELPWDVIRRARVGGTEPIPLLSELFEEFPATRINIDPKDDAAVEPLAELIQRHNAVDRVCIGSFSDGRIARLRRLLGEHLCTALGPRATRRMLATARGLAAPRFDGACLQVPVSMSGVPIVTRGFVNGVHRHGLQVHVWTINDAAEMHRLLDLGVDGLMTDQNEVLKAVLQERGDWA